MNVGRNDQREINEWVNAEGGTLALPWPCLLTGPSPPPGCCARSRTSVETQEGALEAGGGRGPSCSGCCSGSLRSWEGLPASCTHTLSRCPGTAGPREGLPVLLPPAAPACERRTQPAHGHFPGRKSQGRWPTARLICKLLGCNRRLMGGSARNGAPVGPTRAPPASTPDAHHPRPALSPRSRSPMGRSAISVDDQHHCPEFVPWRGLKGKRGLFPKGEGGRRGREAWAGPEGWRSPTRGVADAVVN